MNNKLIILTDKAALKQGFQSMPIVIACSVFLFYVAGSWNVYFISRFIQICIGFFLVMLGIALMYAFWCRNDDPTAAILDETGIWLPRHGLIPWQEIEDVFTYTYGAPIPFLAIVLKNPKLISQQSTFSGKCVLFWAKVFRYPHIHLSSITTDHDVVVNFAQKYLNNNKQKL